MSATRKIAFTTLGSSGIGKKDKPTPKSLRLEVNLTEPSKEECTEVSYEDLVYNILKKRGNHEKAGGGGSGLDPYASDDEDQLKELAKKFESKYGNVGAGKKKKRKNEFVDKGAGYDDTDSFIDNSEAYDEYVPPNVTTAFGGFYINCGDLEFKAAEFSESESSSEESSSDASGSESSSGESESSSEEESTGKEKDGAPKVRKRLKVSSSDGSDSSRPVTPEPAAVAEKKKEKVELKKKKIEEVKKQNGSVEKAVKLVKSDSEKPKNVDAAKPKPTDAAVGLEPLPKKQTSGLDSIFDTIESVVKGRAVESESRVLNGKPTPSHKPHEVKPHTPIAKPPVSSPPGVKASSQMSKPSLQSAHKPVTVKSETPKPKIVKVAENGITTPASKVEPSVVLQKSDVSVSRVDGSSPPVKKADSQRPPSDESASESESSSSGSDSETEKEHSDADEPTQSQESGAKPTNAKLPEDLPFELLSVINALKEKAEEAKGVKSKFFTEEVNSFLFRIELYSKQLRCGVRQEMYDYLTSFLPCKKMTLLKRARTSLADHIASRKNFLLTKLKTLVDRSLPAFLEKFGTDLKDVVGEERTAVFKSYIASQEEARNTLSKVIFLKSHHFNIIRSRKDSPKEAILIFLENEVSLAFPPHFMSSELIYREMESSHANITSDKKLSAKEKKMDNLRLLSLLIKPTKPPKTVSPVPKSPTKKPRPPSQPKPTSQPKPPEPPKESKLAPNWDVAKEIELKILAEKEFRSDVERSGLAESVIKGPERVKDDKERKTEAVKRPRSDSPEIRKAPSDAKRQNLTVSPETYPKPKSGSPQTVPKTDNQFRNASPEKFSPKLHRPFSASPTRDSPKAKPHGASPNVERLQTPTGSVPVDTYRASVVSVENMSEMARQSKPKSPKPKAVKPPKEKREPKPAATPVVELKQPSKPTFELNTESAKAVESLFAFMSPRYSGDHEVVPSPKDHFPLQEEEFLEAPELVQRRESEVEVTTRKDVKFESISPPEPEESPKAEKDQPDLSWVFHEMSQISQKESEKPAEQEQHDEKVEDQRMHDSFGKMFELTESFIKGTQSKPKQPEKTQNGNYSDSFERFLSVRSPQDVTSELQDLSPPFSSKKHKAMRSQQMAAKPPEPAAPRVERSPMQGEKAYLDFLKSHSRDFGAANLPSPNEIPSSGRPLQTSQPSRQGGIPSYPASQYFKQKEPALPSYYQGVESLQRQRRESDSWGEPGRRQESASPYQRSYSSVSSTVDHNETPVQLSRSQSQMYPSEAHQNPLNYSRSPAMPSMMSNYTSLPSYSSNRGYTSVDDLSVQQAMSQAQASREALANQLLYEQQKQQQQQRVAHYKEAPRSSHSGSANYHNSHR